MRRNGKREGRKVGGPAGQRASARACKSGDAVIYSTAGESRGLEVREGDRILGKLTRMGNNPSPWILQKVSPRDEA